MALGELSIIIIAVIAGVVIFKITKSIIKTIFFTLSFLILIVFVLTAVVLMDANDFKSNFPAKSSLYLLEDKGEIITGFSGILGENFKPTYISNQLDSYNAAYKEGKFDSILGEKYKLVIINKESLGTVKSIEGEGLTLTRKNLDDLLASKHALDDFIRIQAGNISESQLPALRQDMVKSMGVKDDNELKGALFGSMFANAMKEQPLFIFEQLKNNKITIYPETALFKLIKKVPLSFVQSTIVKIKPGD